MANDPVLHWIEWQDQDIFVINKPPGLLTIQDGYNPALPNVRAQLSELFGKVWIVHRLDKETSGALIVAKNARAHRSLSLQFEHRKIQKEYRAIITGRPGWQEMTVEIPLLVNADRKHRTLESMDKGLPAITSFAVVNSGEHHSLIKACPQSGYRHQIRAHLRSLGCTILEDHLYATRENDVEQAVSPVIQRLALHAYKINFEHPSTGERLTVSTAYPPDFAIALRQLGLD